MGGNAAKNMLSAVIVGVCLIFASVAPPPLSGSQGRSCPMCGAGCHCLAKISHSGCSVRSPGCGDHAPGGIDAGGIPVRTLAPRAASVSFPPSHDSLERGSRARPAVPPRPPLDPPPEIAA